MAKLDSIIRRLIPSLEYRSADPAACIVPRSRSNTPAEKACILTNGEPDETNLEGGDQPTESSYGRNATGGPERHLGLRSTTFLNVGRMIGNGIFATLSSITAGVGSVGAALMLWVLGLLLAFAGLFVWTEFACMFPKSGGEKNYLEAVYRRPKLLATIVFSTQAILLGFTAAGCIVFAENMFMAAGYTASAWQSRSVAVGVILIVTLLHTLTPRLGVMSMDIVTSMKIAILLFIIITGFIVLCGGVSKVPDPGASFRNSFASSVNSSGPYATAMFKVLNSYMGWSNAANVLSEVRQPIRTIRIAGPLGLGIVGVLYILTNVAYFSAATPAEISNSGITVASYFVGKVYGPTARRVISVFIGLSALGNVLTVTYAQARVNQELAKEGVIPFPRLWASNWPRKSPSGGLLLHFIPSFIVIVAIPAGHAYFFIINVQMYPVTVIYTFVVIGLLLMRWRAPDIHRPFKPWLIVPIFFLGSMCFLLAAPWIRPPGGIGDIPELPYWLYLIVRIVILLTGVVYWALWRIVMPKVGGFEWVERRGKLSDGTEYTYFVKNKDL